MVDLFMIALMVLSCLLGPEDAAQLAIDVLDPATGEVRTVEATRTPQGYHLGSAGETPVVITKLGRGRFKVVLPGEEDPIAVDLSAAVTALEKRGPVQSFELQERTVRVTRSRGLNYMAVPKSSEARLFVVRAAPAPAEAGAAPR